jgi:Polyketide cyclase / dehydrase and lipid transport
VASIYKEIVIDAPAALAWDALRDFGAVHTRLVPGFLVAGEVDGDERTVTFFDGTVVRERLVGVDENERRLAYTVTQSPLGGTHHNASAQVFETGARQTRFVWVTDVLPDELATPIAAFMDRGLATIKETLEAAVVV